MEDVNEYFALRWYRIELRCGLWDGTMSSIQEHCKATGISMGTDHVTRQLCHEQDAEGIAEVPCLICEMVIM